MKERFSRRQFFAAASTVVALSSSTAAYGMNALDDVQLTREQVVVGANAAPWMRIGFLSDIHLTGDKRQQGPFSNALKVLQAAKPDIVLLGGDYLLILDQFISQLGFSMSGERNWFMEETRYERNRDHVRSLFRTVATSVRSTFGPEIPVIAILGNHDNWHGPDICKDEFSQQGIELLVNSATRREHKGRSCFFYGTDDFGTAYAKIAPAETGELKILLTHNPDIFSLAHDIGHLARYDFAVCGHSHGGQIRLPVVGAPFSNLYDSRFLAGWAQCEGSRVFTSRGVGTSGVPLRVNCPPEAVLFEVR